jgi:predicted nucleic acid-binding protein
MNVIDSSGWLEYFAGGPNAAFFSPPLQNTTELIVPSITICEVFKTVLRQRNESDALQAVALMMQSSVVDLTANISILAAKISLEHEMPMADSIILATARLYQATV